MLVCVLWAYQQRHSPGCSWVTTIWRVSAGGSELSAVVRRHRSDLGATAVYSGNRTPFRSPHDHTWSLDSWHNRRQWLHTCQIKQTNTFTAIHKHTTKDALAHTHLRTPIKSEKSRFILVRLQETNCLLIIHVCSLSKTNMPCYITAAIW